MNCLYFKFIDIKKYIYKYLCLILFLYMSLKCVFFIINLIFNEMC